MTYAETLDYLYQQLPMFQRVGAVAFKKDLSNTRKLLQVMGKPEEAFPSLHIAGTNGKGSVSNLVASALQEAGFKVGLYTSPHLRSFTERIRINGQEIPEQAVVDFVERYREAIEEIQPSFFEVTVAMAFDHFRNENVNMAVVEVGMGGRLDSTNVLKPVAGLVTNISLDHMEHLGATLPLIAGEKAGIFKWKMPIVIGEDHPETRPVFEEKAREMESPLTFAAEVAEAKALEESLTRQRLALSWRGLQLGEVDLPLGGAVQVLNARTALSFLKTLQERDWIVPDTAILRGFENVISNTGFRGRMTRLSEKPLVVADVGHNEAGVRYALDHLVRFHAGPIHFVWGMVNDKEVGKILGMLPREATYYFVKADVPRGKDASELASIAGELGLQGEVYPSVNAGLEAAQAAWRPGELIFVGGSTFVVAEVV